MSGSGRFLIPLLKRGVKVEGVDASPDMLKACRERCARENLSPVLYDGFLETMTLHRTYGMIFILSGSFGLITDRHLVIESLERVFKHLAVNGRLIVEIETPTGKGCGLKEWSSRSVDRLDGAQVVCRSQGNYAPHDQLNRIICEYRLVRDGHIVEEESEELSIRYYEIQEFHDLLNNAGFTDILCVRPYGDISANEDDEAAVFICRKA